MASVELCRRCGWLRVDAGGCETEGGSPIVKQLNLPTETARSHSKRGKHDGGYKWQAPVATIQCYVDSDWGGCVRTRKSTSGGALVRGSHCLHHWSRTQASVALSSGEAELNAALKGGTELVGARSLLAELNLPVQLEILGDSTACSGTVHREGTGRVKHFEIK